MPGTVWACRRHARHTSPGAKRARPQGRPAGHRTQARQPSREARPLPGLASVAGAAGEPPAGTTRLLQPAHGHPPVAAPPGAQSPAVPDPVMADGGTARPPLAVARAGAWPLGRDEGLHPSQPLVPLVLRGCLPAPQAGGLRASQPKVELVRQGARGPRTLTLSAHLGLHPPRRSCGAASAPGDKHGPWAPAGIPGARLLPPGAEKRPWG